MQTAPVFMYLYSFIFKNDFKIPVIIFGNCTTTTFIKPLLSMKKHQPKNQQNSRKRNRMHSKISRKTVGKIMPAKMPINSDMARGNQILHLHRNRIFLPPFRFLWYSI